MTGREALTSSRQAFEVVDAFEQAVARYTGAPYCVAVDSCTNALFLCLVYALRDADDPIPLTLPPNIYPGVAMAARLAGCEIRWLDDQFNWQDDGGFELSPLNIWDYAKRFTCVMYKAGTMQCVSFQASKLLPIGRGGAILHDNSDFDRWARRARNDGRQEGALCGTETDFPIQGFHMYMTPPDAARGLWLLTYYPEHMPDQVDEYADLSGVELFK